MNQEINILLRHGFMPMPRGNSNETNFNTKAAIATVLCNMTYYGYALNISGYENIQALTMSQIEKWWDQVEPELKDITGDNRNIANFVVYKNFPQEVLDMSEAEYWTKQILMYWGFPNEYFSEDVEPRDGMDEQHPAKVLQLANSLSLESILNNYLSSTSRWKNTELQDVIFLITNHLEIDFTRISFKENLVNLAYFMIENNRPIKIDTATDILRLAAGISNEDISLRNNVRFRNFSRKERRFFLQMLENCENLIEDFGRRKEVWKRFLHRMHAGDYKKSFPKVLTAMDMLYNDNIITFNSLVETKLNALDESVIGMLKKRPGEFRRRLVHLIDLFGIKAAKSFCSDAVLSQLTNAQLVAIQKFLETANSRKTRCFPPKGNWGKLQIGPARHIDQDAVELISDAISSEIKDRMKKIGPKVLDPATAMITLPLNDGEVATYSRGTRFPIPENIKFIRTASYWKIKRNMANTWFDNGWNFFNKNWESIGTCCWSATHDMRGAAIFSGDPTNSKEMKGRAAQLIDLYLDKLEEQGVTYAVWSILSYNGIPFSEADEVYAALQWGEKKQKGKLFEPSRCQLSFPLTDEQKTRFICYIDIPNREMVFMDVSLRGNLNSAVSNAEILNQQMPAFTEYLGSLPTVYDLFRNSEDPKNGKGFVLYSDRDVKLDGERAYVFKPENENNKFHKVGLNNILGMKR